MWNRLHLVLFAICLLISQTLVAQSDASSQRGTFSGELILKALDDGRSMQVVKDFSYTDWQGHTLTATAGFVSDGATIPRAVWTIVGGPWDGPYRKAAVVHDVGCENHKYTWRDTDRLFFEAMLDSGVTRPLALTMYYGVLVGGPRWDVVATTSAKTSKELDQKVGRELSKLTETERKDAVVESVRTDKTSNNKITSEYSATVTVPTSSPEVSENDLKALETELSQRTANGEQITAEEIEKRAAERPAPGTNTDRR